MEGNKFTWTQKFTKAEQFKQKYKEYLENPIATKYCEIEHLETEPKMVAQTHFTNIKENIWGNCYQAAIATLLGLDIEQVIDLRPGNKPTFWKQSKALNVWLRKLGLYTIHVPLHVKLKGFYLASGIVDRDCGYPDGYLDINPPVSHTVVMYNDKMYFDPHPSNMGLTNILNYTLFVPKNPFENSFDRSRVIPHDQHLKDCIELEGTYNPISSQEIMYLIGSLNIPLPTQKE